MHDAALVEEVGGYAEAQFLIKADDLHLRVDDDVGAAQNLPAVGNGRLHHFQAVPLSTHGCEHPADVGATVFSVASGIGDDLVVLAYSNGVEWRSYSSSSPQRVIFCSSRKTCSRTSQMRKNSCALSSQKVFTVVVIRVLAIALFKITW